MEHFQTLSNTNSYATLQKKVYRIRCIPVLKFMYFIYSTGSINKILSNNAIFIERFMAFPPSVIKAHL